MPPSWKNTPDCELHVKLAESPYLRCQRKAAIEDFARNALSLRRTKKLRSLAAESSISYLVLLTMF